MPADFVTETDDGTFVAFAVVTDAADWPDVDLPGEGIEAEPLHELAEGRLLVAIEGTEAAEVERAVLGVGRPATPDEINP